MGRLKTPAMKDQDMMRKAHRMAEAYATHQTKERLKTFLGASKLHERFAFAEGSAKEFAQRLLVIKKAEHAAASVQKNEVLAQKIQAEIEDLNTWTESEHIGDHHQALSDMTENPEVDLHFGMALAIAYVMGYSDHARGSSLKQLYVPKEHADKLDVTAPIGKVDEPGKLILPPNFKA